MEELTIHLSELGKAIATLREALYLRDVARREDPRFLLASEDSIIQRFEYTYESFWKFLKKYLELKFGMNDVVSPKKVFHMSTKVGLCTEDEGAILVDMSDARNATTHTYSARELRSILEDVPRYCATMVDVVERLRAHH